jgi:hypothetical protein
MVNLMNCLCLTLLAADDASAAEPTDLFSSFPEFLVSDLVEFLPHARSVLVSSASVSAVLELLVRGMESNNRVSNKHLRGQMARAMSRLPITVLIGSSVVSKRLARACVAVWVAVEDTGRNNQWFVLCFGRFIFFFNLMQRYEKLEIRQSIMSLFQSLRGVDWFMRSISSLWHSDK